MAQPPWTSNWVGVYVRLLLTLVLFTSSSTGVSQQLPRVPTSMKNQLQIGPYPSTNFGNETNVQQVIDKEDGGCPELFTQYGEYCFRQWNDLDYHTQSSAAELCANLSSSLAYPIGDLRRWQTAVTAVIPEGLGCWSGAAKQNNGVWTWPDGKQVQVAAWEIGEPLGGGECSSIYGDTGLLYAFPCTSSRALLCQVPFGSTTTKVPDETSTATETSLTTSPEPSYVCPDGFMNYGKYCFFRNNTYLYHGSANDFCNNLNSKMSYPTSDLDDWQAAVAEAIPDGEDLFWSGGTVYANGGWRWPEHGAQVPEAAWKSGEPDGDGECSYLDTNGQLFDWTCNGIQYVLCQVPAETTARSIPVENSSPSVLAENTIMILVIVMLFTYY